MVGQGSHEPRSPRPLLTPPQVAGLLGVTTRTVRRWALDGTLDRIQLGGRLVRFDPAAVEALIAGESRIAPAGETRAIPNSGGQPRHDSA